VYSPRTRGRPSPTRDTTRLNAAQAGPSTPGGPPHVGAEPVRLQPGAPRAAGRIGQELHASIPSDRRAGLQELDPTGALNPSCFFSRDLRACRVCRSTATIAGSQYTSMRLTEHLALEEITALDRDRISV